jgi:arylsulfatase A-like enzyme
MRHKNILILVVDCLRGDIFTRSSHRLTPFIDTLREKGTTYINAFSVASSTTPAIASIMTGLYPPVHGLIGLMGYKLKSSCKTLSEILLSNGYNTYAFVSGPLIPETSLNKGFIEYHHRRPNDYVYTSFGKRLINSLRSLKSPWFCFIHLWEVHVPRQAPYTTSDNLTLYERAASCLDRWLYENLLEAIDLQDTIVVFTADHGERDSPFIDSLLVSKNFRRIDRRLHIKKRFMSFRRRYLANRKRLSLWFGHGYHLYDFLIKIPLIIVAKDDLGRATIKDELVSQVDILPTLLELTGIKSCLNINGKSMINGRLGTERALYIEASNLTADSGGSLWLKGVRTSEWKYIVPAFNKGLKEELYNLREDPDEKRNLISEKDEYKTKMFGLLCDIEREMDDLRKIYSDEAVMNGEEISKMKRLLKELGYL